MFLFCAAAWAMISATGKPANADDKANGKANAGLVEASACLQVGLNEKMLTSATGQNLQAEFEIYKKTQKQLLLNPLVLQAALRNPEIAALKLIKDRKDPIDWLARNLQIAFPDDAKIMQISIAGPDRKECAILVNAVVDAYFREFVDGERKKREERISDLRRIYEDKLQETKDSLNELRKIADMLGTSDSEILNVKQKNTLEELGLLRAELIRGQFELNRMRRELASQQAAMQALESEPITDHECQQSASSDPVLKKLGEELVARDIAEDAKDNAALDRLKKLYADRLEQIRVDIGGKKRADIEKEIKKIEAAISLTAKEQTAVEEDVARLRKEADRFGTSSIEMQLRRADIAHKHKALDTLATELDALRMEAKTPPRVAIVSKAEVPE
jgi:hypothetical protein